MRFSIMDHTGHTTLEFDLIDPEQRAKAQEVLDKLVAERHTLAVRSLSPGDYHLLRPDGSGRVGVARLDPDSEVLGIPQLKGG